MRGGMGDRDDEASGLARGTGGGLGAGSKWDSKNGKTPKEGRQRGEEGKKQ